MLRPHIVTFLGSLLGVVWQCDPGALIFGWGGGVNSESNICRCWWWGWDEGLQRAGQNYVSFVGCRNLGSDDAGSVVAYFVPLILPQSQILASMCLPCTIWGQTLGQDQGYWPVYPESLPPSNTQVVHYILESMLCFLPCSLSTVCCMECVMWQLSCKSPSHFILQNPGQTKTNKH